MSQISTPPHEKEKTTGEIQMFEDVSTLERGPNGRLAETDPAVVKKIIRRCDYRILPVMSVLYLLSFLDRTAIGNARIAGLTKDLKMTPREYAASVTVFFILYGLLEVPSNLMLKKYGAKRWIPFIMFCWGVVMTLTALVKSYEGLLVARLFLGGAEAGLFPGITYYLTTWYVRAEAQVRVGFFFGAATIAGAFGGLLAFGLTKIHTETLKPWAMIFLVEGLMTCVAAIAAYFFIFDSPKTSSFLSKEEQEILTNRLRYDGVAVPMSDHFSWKFVRTAFVDWKLWMVFQIYVCSLCAVYSIALNLPSITVGLGYSGPEAQLITVPVYVFSSILVIVLAIIADKYAIRSPMILLGLIMSFIGYLIMYLSYTPGVRYFGAFLASGGAYSSFPGVVCLSTNNVGGKTKRSTEIGLLVGIGGMCGMISSNIFPSTDGPHYGPGCLINVGLTAYGILMTVLNVFLLKRANRSKQARIDSGEAAKLTETELSDLGDESPFFKYTI